ncbi:MAG: ABC transporter permease [Gammaproteobacteria bacterium]
MFAADVLQFAYRSLRAYVMRTLLILSAMAIGVSAVIFLTTLGESARRYVIGEFTALGSHLLIVLPGRSETVGGHPPTLGETPRDLTVDDALALSRSRHVRHIAPVVVGAAPASWREREREVTVIGTTSEFFTIRQLQLAQGGTLGKFDARRAAAVAVIGPKVKQELFGARSALGEWLRVGNRRYRIAGVLASAGRSLGLDREELVIIAVASAQALFDTPALFRILVQARSESAVPLAKADVESIVRERHDGEQDITVITQDALISTFGRILSALTLTLAGIAAISLVVAGVLIMNVMLVAVSQRTPEIGLLKALGAPAQRIARLFLTEAGLLALAGGMLGALLGLGAAALLGRLYPALPVHVPFWAIAAALLVALLTGLLFGALPARRAAALDPVQALSRR